MGTHSKEPSHLDGSFELPKHMFKLTGKKIITILRSKSFACITYLDLLVGEPTIQKLEKVAGK